MPLDFSLFTWLLILICLHTGNCSLHSSKTSLQIPKCTCFPSAVSLLLHSMLKEYKYHENISFLGFHYILWLASLFNCILSFFFFYCIFSNYFFISLFFFLLPHYKYSLMLLGFGSFLFSLISPKTPMAQLLVYVPTQGWLEECLPKWCLAISK